MHNTIEIMRSNSSASPLTSRSTFALPQTPVHVDSYMQLEEPYMSHAHAILSAANIQEFSLCGSLQHCSTRGTVHSKKRK